MGVNVSRTILLTAMVACFVEAAKVPHNDPGTVATVVMGILLLRRALVISQPPVVAVSGCVVTAIIILGDGGRIDINRPLWLWPLLILVAFAVFGWWERIEKLWKRMHRSGAGMKGQRGI